jgi:hypothetical protein
MKKDQIIVIRKGRTEIVGYITDLISDRDRKGSLAIGLVCLIVIAGLIG